MKELISEITIKNNSFVDDNINSRDINNALKLAQNIDLKRLVSNKLYSQMMLEPVTDADLAMFISDYLPDLVEWYTVSKLIDIKAMKITARGNSKSENDSNIAAELSDIRRTISVVNGYAASFEKQALKYIDDNPAIFDKYYDSDEYNGLDNVPTKAIFDRRLLK
jgi:hypothetical protein